jgi:hypothetical protein
MKRLKVVAIGCAVILLIGFTFRPIQNIESSQCKVISGTVESVFEGGTNDINFTLKNKNGSYYINRGMEKGLDLGLLKDEMPGKEVKIWYVYQYSFITLLAPSKHISKMEVNGEVLFNELVNESE